LIRHGVTSGRRSNRAWAEHHPHLDEEDQDQRDQNEADEEGGNLRLPR